MWHNLPPGWSTSRSEEPCERWRPRQNPLASQWRFHAIGSGWVFTNKWNIGVARKQAAGCPFGFVFALHSFIGRCNIGFVAKLCHAVERLAWLRRHLYPWATLAWGWMGWIDVMAEHGFVLRFCLDVMTPKGSRIFHTSLMRITKTCVSGFDMVRCLDMNQKMQMDNGL